MKDLFKLFSQILLLLVFISSIKTTYAAVNYKLTSVVREYGGNLSSWVGKRQAIIDIYVGWCNHSFGWFYNLDLNTTWRTGSVPMITWVIIDCSERYESGIIKLVNNNTFDGYINQFSDRLKEWLAGPDGIYGTDDDRRAYLRLGMKLDRIGYSDRKKTLLFVCHESALDV
jgi:hypothetical protein